MTPIYAAPELLIYGKYSKKSDIWALGSVYFEELMLSYGRKGAFRSITEIISYYFNQTLPPRQITWETVGESMESIPLDCQVYRPSTENVWSQINIILAVTFRRDPGEWPNVETLKENFQLLGDGIELTLPDYRIRNVQSISSPRTNVSPLVRNFDLLKTVTQIVVSTILWDE